METLLKALQNHAALIVEQFYGALVRLPKSKLILDMLSAQELQHLKSQQIQNLLALASPSLDEAAQEKLALRVGRIHAIVGLDREELIHGRGILASAVFETIGDMVDPQSLATYNRRLSRDLAYQVKAYQQILNAQQDVLLSITKMVWSVESYADFIEQAIAILSAHEEFALCTIGRPDEHGVFNFEAAAGSNATSGVPALLVTPGSQPVIHADDPAGQGPAGRAWRSGKVERIINFRTYARLAAWYAQALEEGLRSCAAVPLHAPNQPVAAVMLLFSAFPGGFIGPHQVAFIDLLQTLLGCAIARLKERDTGDKAISIAVRQHWAALVRSNALQMHYQPLLDLRTGAVGKVEALARLRDAGQLLLPADFFPALSSDDFLELFARGLDQALADRKRWLAQGADLDMSVNLPPAALNDVRYFEAACAALKRHACPPGRLTLEVLENEALSLNSEQQAILSDFKAYGKTGSPRFSISRFAQAKSAAACRALSSSRSDRPAARCA